MTSASEASSPSQFQGLIDTLRDEAVEKAEKESARIVTAAEKRAAKMLADARSEAEGIVTAATREAEQSENSGNDALQRASRDVLLSLESAITDQLDVVIQRETRAVLRGEALAVTVRTLVEKWSFEEDETPELEVLMNEADLSSLEEAGWHGLKEDLLEGVAFRPVPDIEAGLRIGQKDGSVHYDFTARTLAEWMSRFVTPRVRDMLREASAEQPDE